MILLNLDVNHLKSIEIICINFDTKPVRIFLNLVIKPVGMCGKQKSVSHGNHRNRPLDSSLLLCNQRSFI